MSLPVKIASSTRKREARRHGIVRPLLPLLLLIFIVSSILQGCSGANQEDEQVSFEAPLLWPSPPASPRVAFEMTLEKPSDIGARKGFFKSITNFLLGESPDRIIKPYGIASDSNGRVLVADTALKAIHIFDLKHERYSIIDRVKKEGFRSPVGIATDGEDNIYISDSELEKVFVLNSKGRLKYSIERKLDRPAGIAVDRVAKRLYVVNTWGHNIGVYDTENGEFIFSIGERGLDKGEFNFPTNVFVDKHGDIYVTDSLNYRVQIFRKDGKFITLFGNQGVGSGTFSRPRGIGVDSAGHIYVVDALFDTVQIFNRKGEYLLKVGASGQERGKFWLPSGLFIDDNNLIYIADSYNRRVQILRYIGEDAGEAKNEK